MTQTPQVWLIQQPSLVGDPSPKNLHLPLWHPVRGSIQEDFFEVFRWVAPTET